MTPLSTQPEATDVVTLLQQMVQIDSVTSSISGDSQAESRLCDLLESYARHWGLHCERLKVSGSSDQLLVSAEQHREKPLLLFDSHLDTVGVDGMIINPFSGECKEGRVFGRGSCDTKGSGAAMLWALKGCDADKHRRNNAAVLFSVDEENLMTGIRSFVRQDLPQMRQKPAAVIVGEPTALAPVVAHNGILRLKISTTGLAVHSSDPSKGTNAISGMIRLVDRLESRYIDRLKFSHDLTGSAACSVTQIHGGSGVNIIPDNCWIGIDRRTLPGESNDQAQQDIERILHEVLAGGEERVHFSVERTFDTPPMRPEVAEPLISPICKILEQCGLSSKPTGAPFGTHGGILTGRGLPAIVLGPGDAAKAHTRDESIAVAEVTQAVEVYRRLIETADLRACHEYRLTSPARSYPEASNSAEQH